MGEKGESTLFERKGKKDPSIRSKTETHFPNAEGSTRTNLLRNGRRFSFEAIFFFLRVETSTKNLDKYSLYYEANFKFGGVFRYEINKSDQY